MTRLVIPTLGLSAAALALALVPLPANAAPVPTAPTSTPADTTETPAPAVSVSTPNSPDHPVVITVTGLEGRHVAVVGGPQGGDTTHAFGLGLDSTTPFAPHVGGWQVGTTYEWSFSFSDGTHITRAFHLASEKIQQEMEVALTPPASPTDATVLTITGLKPEQWVDVVGGPKDWAHEAPYFREVQQQGSDPMTVRVDAPHDGWPVGAEYLWSVSLPDGTFVYRSFTLPNS